MIKKRSFGKYILLTIVTLGIYNIFFWYKWTEDVNKLCEGDDKDSANYILDFILDWCSLGINTLAWNCKMGERLFQKAADYGVEFKHGGMFFMLARFIPFLSASFKISYVNKLAEIYNAQLPAEAPAAEENAAEAEDAEVTVEATEEAAQ